MKTARIMSFVCLTACCASTAFAQYGLYGAPETLPATQSYSTPSSYPTTATPMAQPAPVTSYRPVQQYSYPAQANSVAMYQPYQPGAQYRYPTPSARPQVRMAAVQQPQPIPAPQGTPMEPVPQDSGMMDQMLTEQNSAAPCNNGYANGNCNGAYRGAINQYEQSACGPGAEACGYDGSCYSCPWYGSVSALVLGRSDGRRIWTSYLDGHAETQLTNTQFGMPWKWGGEAQFGRRFCCGCTPYALEATFWSTEAFSGTKVTDLYTGQTTPQYVSTPLQIGFINFDFGGGNICPATDIFSGAQSHTLTRRNEFYDFEINLLREQMAWACDSPWDIGWSVGVRYFRFQESLAFSAISHDGDMSAYFRDTATNNLLGVQFGFDAAYNVARCVRLFITPSVGIYDNFLDSTFEAKGRQGSGAYVNGTVDVPGYSSFPANGSTNGIAFLTQIDVGADWQFSRNWSARAGYRVLAITGVALADDQFPQYLCDTPDMGNPQHCSSLVLHGAFGGLTYNF